MSHDSRLIGHITARWVENDGTVRNMAQMFNWVPTQISDVLADDSDKTITVTAGFQWDIQTIFIEYTSDANAGARQISVQIQDDSANVLFEIPAGTTQTDTLVRNYLYGSNLPDLTSFRNTDQLLTPLPAKLILPSAYVIRVYDTAAIAATTDDMDIRLLVNQRVNP